MIKRIISWVQRRKAFKEQLNLDQYGGASDTEEEREDANNGGLVKVYKGAQLTSTVTVAPMKMGSSDSELSAGESDVDEEKEEAEGSRPWQGGGRPGPEHKDSHGKKLGKGALKAMESIKMKLAGKKVKKKGGKSGKREGGSGGKRGGRGGGRGGKSRR